MVKLYHRNGMARIENGNVRFFMVDESTGEEAATSYRSVSAYLRKLVIALMGVKERIASMGDYCIDGVV